MGWILAVGALVLVLGLHVSPLVRSAGAWATFDGEPPWRSAVHTHVEQGDVYLGLSYGLTAAFTTVVVAVALARRRRRGRRSVPVRSWA